MFTADLFIHILSIMLIICGIKTLKLQNRICLLKINSFDRISAYSIILFIFLTVISIFYARTVNFDTPSENELGALELSRISYSTMFFATVVYGPILEEIFFRGLLLNFMMRKFSNSTAAAMIISTTFWSFLHFDFYCVTIIELIISGSILSVLAIRTNALVIGIFLHMSNNFSAVSFN